MPPARARPIRKAACLPCQTCPLDQLPWQDRSGKPASRVKPAPWTTCLPVSDLLPGPPALARPVREAACLPCQTCLLDHLPWQDRSGRRPASRARPASWTTCPSRDGPGGGLPSMLGLPLDHCPSRNGPGGGLPSVRSRGRPAFHVERSPGPLPWQDWSGSKPASHARPSSWSTCPGRIDPEGGSPPTPDPPPGPSALARPVREAPGSRVRPASWKPALARPVPPASRVRPASWTTRLGRTGPGGGLPPVSDLPPGPALACLPYQTCILDHLPWQDRSERRLAPMQDLPPVPPALAGPVWEAARLPCQAFPWTTALAGLVREQSCLPYLLDHVLWRDRSGKQPASHVTPASWTTCLGRTDLEGGLPPVSDLLLGPPALAGPVREARLPG